MGFRARPRWGLGCLLALLQTLTRHSGKHCMGRQRVMCGCLKQGQCQPGDDMFAKSLSAATAVRLDCPSASEGLIAPMLDTNAYCRARLAKCARSKLQQESLFNTFCMLQQLPTGACVSSQRRYVIRVLEPKYSFTAYP
jgi:hypothetical protein